MGDQPPQPRPARHHRWRPLMRPTSRKSLLRCAIVAVVVPLACEGHCGAYFDGYRSSSASRAVRRRRGRWQRPDSGLGGVDDQDVPVSQRKQVWCGLAEVAGRRIAGAAGTDRAGDVRPRTRRGRWSPYRQTATRLVYCLMSATGGAEPGRRPSSTAHSSSTTQEPVGRGPPRCRPATLQPALWVPTRRRSPTASSPRLATNRHSAEQKCGDVGIRARRCDN